MNKKLRVLCIYGEALNTQRDEDPRISLVDCDVVVVGTYDVAKDILQTLEVVPPFDVILSDLYLFKDRSLKDTAHLSPILLKGLCEQKLVGGLGIFVPQHFESSFEVSDGYTVTVASQNCWDFDGSRDWKKLFDLVVATSLESDTFNHREH